MMLLTSLLALALTLLPSTTAQGVTINSPCRGSGYQCIQGNHAIASCDGRQWKLAAEGLAYNRSLVIGNIESVHYSRPEGQVDEE
ncbi:uncharacterized protein BDV17DRAFT_294212 [Aspergillus undulatus]|uniref:uncharacterized protein n=1 Tax=Aspergillus undulatus TaxID=1810928 RepID=UPI003CCCFF8B